MFSAVDRAWRRVSQPLSFVVFGVGALVLGSIFLPLVWLLPMPVSRKTGVVQKTIHYSFRFFLWFVEAFKTMEFRMEGADALQSHEGGLVIANHPTLLDVVVLISRLPQADCIVKKELWDNFFLKRVVSGAGYIPNDDGLKLAEEAMKRIRAGRTIIIFPEGTRSFPNGLRPFTKGFAHIAVRSGCRLRPVVMNCRPSALTKGRSVFNVPETRARLTASVRSAITPAEYYETVDSAAVAVRKLTAAMQQYFEESVDHAGDGTTRD
jgi:1-acyl-sn-glycerol-3-phosphate acyltransferase